MILTSSKPQRLIENIVGFIEWLFEFIVLNFKLKSQLLIVLSFFLKVSW